MEQNIKDAILKPREFKTRACVADWFKELLDAGLNFHPEDSGDFIDTETRKPTFTRAERVLYEALMDNAWHCCSKYEPAIDPSDIACEVFNQWLADNGLLNNTEKTVAAAARLKQGFTPLQQAARDVTDWVANPQQEAHWGGDKREQVTVLCKLVGIPEPEWPEDEDEEE